MPHIIDTCQINHKEQFVPRASIHLTKKAAFDKKLHGNRNPAMWEQISDDS